MLAHPETYEDAQYQNYRPIGEQPPIPPGVHDIELSWDRSRGYMRIIIGGTHSWWFREFLGKAQVLSCDNKRGRLNLRAMARIDNETLTMYRDPNAPPHEEVDGDRREKTHNRLCNHRRERCGPSVRHGVVRRYLTMLIMAIILAVYIPIAMSPWIIVGPRRLLGRTRRHTRRTS